MKIALSWLKKHIELFAPISEITDKLTFAGLEVEHIEESSSIKGGLQGIFVGEVLSCSKIPDTERLNITTINIGNGNQPLNIVCGAPNVATGQKVLVATVGCILHPTKGDAFEIKKAKIRGVASEGMLCAEDELGLGQSHDGIIILPNETPVGTKAADFYPIEKETVLEIGLTANRGDAASHLGVARDLSALFDLKLKDNFKAIEYPTERNPIEVEIMSEDCPRYSGALIQNVEMAESPDWLKKDLKSIGIEPINNIVDITNYVLHDLGQPIHAFDAAKIKGNKIIVRKAFQGEKLVTLDEKERELQSNQLVIADAHKSLAIAGVFGGLESGITKETKSIFIESAFFNPVSVRKTAKHFGLNTDASFRYERGTDPNITVKALDKVVQLILEIAGGSLAGHQIDVYPKPIHPVQIALRINSIKRVLGIEIPKTKVISILEKLEIKIIKESQDDLILSVPPFKSDVTREIDVIEEIVRIYGFDNVPLKSSTQLYLSQVEPSRLFDIKSKATKILQGMGFTEIMNNSMISTQEVNETLIKLTNPLSKETDTMRHDLQEGMVASIAFNINRKIENLKFFEFGTCFKKAPNGKMIETPHLSLGCCGNVFHESWQFKEYGVNEAYLKNCVEELLKSLGVDKKRIPSCIVIKPSQMEPKQQKKHKILKPIYYTEINLIKVNKPQDELKVKDIPLYPSVRRDLSLVIDKKIQFNQVEKITQQLAGPLLVGLNVFDIYEGKPMDSNQKSYSVSFTWLDETKTLEDKYIDPIVDKMISAFETELGATIRR